MSDYLEVELRRFSDFFNIPLDTLRARWAENADRFRLIASLKLGCEMSEVTDKQRAEVKLLSFPIMYGQNHFPGKAKI